MMKPENLCDELGCMREWEVLIVQYGQPTLSSQGSTAMNTKVCDECAARYEAKAAAAL